MKISVDSSYYLLRSGYIINNMEIDLTAVSISVVALIAIVFASKILISNQNQGSKYVKLKMKEMEEYAAYQKKQIQVYKNKASNMEKPPQVEGDIDELGDIMPELVSQFAQYAPKWVQPFLKDENAQKWILDYVQKNPDTAKKWFGKMIGKKIGVKSDNNEQSTDNEISV